MIKAYETEGHGIYWQVFEEKDGNDFHLFDGETLQEVIDYARSKAQALTLYTQEWYLLQEGEEE
jgi:hypothetical protein